VNRGNTAQKLKVLRAGLQATTLYQDAAPSLDAAVRGDPNPRVSNSVPIQQHLRPEVLLRLDRSALRPTDAILTEVDPPVVILATVEQVEEWITKLEGPTSKSELSAAAHALERAISQRLSGADLSSSQSALAKIKRALGIG